MSRRIFGIPIYHGKVKDHQLIDDVITQEIIDTTATDIGSWIGTVKSSARDELNRSWYSFFHDAIKPNIQDFFNEVYKVKEKYETNLMRPWINLYTRGSSQEWHSHTGYPTCPIMFSYNYIHKQPKDNYAKFVLKSRNEDYEWHYPIEFKSQTDVYPELKQHDIIIFPSWLYHAVTKHESDEERITIAGDFSVRKIT